MPIFFLSGAIFPIENLPSVIYSISMIDPLTYGVDGMRGATAGISTFGVYSDLVTILTLSALICAIGTVLFSRIDAS
jgi:ABC-2 type transport system permease protein